MSSRHSLPPRPRRMDRRPLLSVCTILILSGFLLGIAIGTRLTGDLRLLVVISGLVGLIAFLGLDHVGFRRRQQHEREEQEYIESRLAMHIISTDSAEIDHEELMALAREATATADHQELTSSGTSR